MVVLQWNGSSKHALLTHLRMAQGTVLLLYIGRDKETERKETTANSSDLNASVETAHCTLAYPQSITLSLTYAPLEYHKYKISRFPKNFLIKEQCI